MQPVRQEAETVQPGSFLEKLKIYISAKVAPTTARQWSNKADMIFNHWQETIAGFDPDKLFEALHHNVLFPSLKSYLDASTVVGDKLTAIKVYKYIANFLLERFDERYWIKKKKKKNENVLRYSMDARWANMEKLVFSNDIKDKRDSHSAMSKRLEKEAKTKTRQNKTVAQEEGTRVEYRDPVRLKEAMF